MTVNLIAYDLAKENAADLIMEQIDNWIIPIDFLVNNAGFNECGLFSQTDINKEIKMIDLHIRFITQLTKRILSIMEKTTADTYLILVQQVLSFPLPLTQFIRQQKHISCLFQMHFMESIEIQE